MTKKPRSEKELQVLTSRTIAHYDANAASFAEATALHDVSQNYAALLGAIESPRPWRILDLGCGPGRDLGWFKAQGHEAVGLDGSLAFVEMARKATGCQVLHQNFLALDLPRASFHGIFANATMFHVPVQELGRVLRELREALVPRGVLFCSNPRGLDTEEQNGERFGAFHTLEAWRVHVEGAGFTEIEHYYRPEGKPRDEQPWLATVWRA